jgi:hypothetical protein
MMFLTELVKVDNQKFSAYWDELVAACELRTPLCRAHSSTDEVASLESALTTDETFAVEKVSLANIEKDLSFVLLENDEPILACSLLLTSDENGWSRLGYRGFGGATHFSKSAMDASSNNMSSVSCQTVTEHIKRLSWELNPDVIEFQDSLSCGVMSPVTQYLIANGGLPTVSSARLISLVPSSRSLVRGVSKAVRGGIQWGQRNLQLSVHNDNLALRSYLKSHDLMPTKDHCSIAVSLWQSKQFLESLMKVEAGFIVNAMFEGRQLGSAVFACRSGVAQYLGCQIYSVNARNEIMASLVWKGAMHAKATGCAQLTLDHHFHPQSESLIDFRGFGGESHPRVKVLWHKQTLA